MIRFPIAVIVFTIVCGGLLLIGTNPEQVPAVVFILLFLLLYGFCYGVLGLLGSVLSRFEVITWSNTRVQRTALAVASFPVFLIILQSIGQLTIRDVLLASVFFGLLYVYFNRVLTINNHTK